MISAADLVALRAAQAALFPDTCVVWTATPAVDGIGGRTKGWAAGTSYACRLSSRGVPREYLQLAALQGSSFWMVTLSTAAVVVRANRLVIGSRTLEIVGFASGGTWETAKRAVCVEVT